MVFAFILLSFVFIILLILFTSIKIKIEYNNDLKVEFYFGIFKIPESLFEKTKKKDKSENNKKSKSKNKNNKLIEKIKHKGVYNSFLEVVEFLSPTFKELEKFLKKIKVNPLQIDIKMAGEDAADLAIDYGKFCAVYYPVLKLVETKTTCENIKSNVYVDYVSKSNEIYIKTELKIRLIHGVISGLKIILLFLNFKEKFN